MPSLPGCTTQGESFEDAKRMAKDAIKGYISVLQEDGDPIPVESAGLTLDDFKALLS